MLPRTEGSCTYAPLKKSYADILTSTKGGAGGATTTVSTLLQLSSAASAAGARVIVVQGSISGAAKVSVTSDKTIVGKAGSCEIFNEPSTCGHPLVVSSSYRHRSHHPRPEERDRQELEDLQGPCHVR